VGIGVGSRAEPTGQLACGRFVTRVFERVAESQRDREVVGPFGHGLAQLLHPLERIFGLLPELFERTWVHRAQAERLVELAHLGRRAHPGEDPAVERLCRGGRVLHEPPQRDLLGNGSRRIEHQRQQPRSFAPARCLTVGDRLAVFGEDQPRAVRAAGEPLAPEGDALGEGPRRAWGAGQ
jgi:hypothetical protein